MEIKPSAAMIVTDFPGIYSDFFYILMQRYHFTPWDKMCDFSIDGAPDGWVK